MAELVNLEVRKESPVEDVGEYHSLGQINVSVLRAQCATDLIGFAINSKEGDKSNLDKKNEPSLEFIVNELLLHHHFKKESDMLYLVYIMLKVLLSYFSIYHSVLWELRLRRPKKRMMMLPLWTVGPLSNTRRAAFKSLVLLRILRQRSLNL